YEADIALITLLKGKTAELENPIREKLDSKAYPEATKIYVLMGIKKIRKKRKAKKIIDHIINNLSSKLKFAKVDISKIISGAVTKDKFNDALKAVRAQVTQKIVDSCKKYSSLKPNLEPDAKPVINPPVIPIISDNGSEDDPKPRKWNLDGGLLPAYLTYWNADGVRDDRASMRYEGRIGVRFSDDYKLQLDYRGQIDYKPFNPNAEGKLQPFISQGFQDRFALSLQIPHNFVVQGAYVQERLGDREQFMGALGLGYKLKHLDGAAVFSPQLGGILGSSEDGEKFGGGYAALNYSYLLSDPRISFSGTGFYNVLKRAEFDVLGHQFGGSVDLKWAPRPDAHCLLGLAGGVVVNKGVYDSVGVYVGPTLELNFMEMINPSEDIIPPVVRGK
ncbi:MAG: hypothetical protein ABIA67_02745, partial [Candidatus Margulisiibacteriota bacterium]